MSALVTLTMKQRVQACLAEAGYPNAIVYGMPDDPSCGLSLVDSDVDDDRLVPPFVLWQAFRVCGCDFLPCLACWDRGDEDVCAALGRGELDCGIER